jgi:hypothetical protein
VESFPAARAFAVRCFEIENGYFIEIFLIIPERPRNPFQLLVGEDAYVKPYEPAGEIFL